MLLKNNTFTISVLSEQNYSSYKVKLIINESVDLNKVVQSIETYGVQLENIDQEFINYVVRTNVGIDSKELLVANSIVGLPIKIKEKDKQIVFVDEGKNNLRLFIK